MTIDQPLIAFDDDVVADPQAGHAGNGERTLMEIR
jgi:hypothetical protein